MGACTDACGPTGDGKKHVCHKLPPDRAGSVLRPQLPMAMRSSLARNLLDAGCCCVLSAVCPWESWLYPHPTPKASPRILRTRSAYRRRTSQRHEAKVKCSESGSWSLTSTTSIQNGQRVDCPHTHVTVCLLSHVEYPDTLFDDQCVEYPDILYSMISKAVEAR